LKSIFFVNCINDCIVMPLQGAGSEADWGTVLVLRLTNKDLLKNDLCKKFPS
jgi:hypothetical protein